MNEPTTTCEHRRITAWIDEDGTIAVWACADCSWRFYPACPTCVSVGHRSIVHPPTFEAAARERAKGVTA